MKKPLFTEILEAEEYRYLYTDNDNMNYYSAKLSEEYYVLVDDYDCIKNELWSEKHICVLNENKLLYIREEKYGVVDNEGWVIIPFVYDDFRVRNEKHEIKRFDVCLNNRWGVIDLTGKDIFKIRYKDPILIDKSFIIVEDADTGCKGVVKYDGVEIVPVVFSQIEETYLRNDDESLTLYFFVAYGTEEDSDNFLNGIWGCYNWKGEEIIPVKFHSIHCINNYFIVGDDEYIGKDYNDEDYYIGTYDLYDKDGNMILGGFNHIQIKENYFILQFGIEVKPHRKRLYFGKHHLDYVERFNYENSISIIIDKELKSLVPIHLLNETNEEIKYEYDVLMNNIPKGKGFLIDDVLWLKKGLRYSSNDNIIKKICIRSYTIIGNVIIYNPYLEKSYLFEDKLEGTILKGKLCGVLFCKEHTIIAPQYIDIKLINDKLLFIQDKNGLVGIRDSEKVLIVPQFDFVTNQHNNLALAFKIIENEKGNDDRFKCLCVLFTFNNNKIEQHLLADISGKELYKLLYSRKYECLKSLELEDKLKCYFDEIAADDNYFWFPTYKIFQYLYEEDIDEILNEEGDYSSYDCGKEWDDNWNYYNDNLDMDQQSPEFWNF